MSESGSHRILVVDDDTDGLEVLEMRLTHAGYEVETGESAEKALARVGAFAPGLIVTDVRMSGMSGLELLEKVRGAMDDVEVVVMTAQAREARSRLAPDPAVDLRARGPVPGQVGGDALLVRPSPTRGTRPGP